MNIIQEVKLFLAVFVSRIDLLDLDWRLVSTLHVSSGWAIGGFLLLLPFI